MKWTRATKLGGRIVPAGAVGDFKLYVITNAVNGKQYVGTTLGSLEDRRRQHFHQAKKRLGKFSNALRKYGLANFSIRLIRNDARNAIELEKQEIAEIQRRDTRRKGYNSAVGGDLGTSKTITIAGKVYASYLAGALKHNVPPSAFNLRLGRLGWTPEQAAGLEPRKWNRIKVKVGNESLNLRAAALRRGIAPSAVYARREHGWTLEQALGDAPPPLSAKYKGEAVTAFGQKFASLNECARKFDIKPETLRRRVRQCGEPIEQAIAYLRTKPKSGPVRRLRPV